MEIANNKVVNSRAWKRQQKLQKPKVPDTWVLLSFWYALVIEEWLHLMEGFQVDHISRSENGEYINKFRLGKGEASSFSRFLPETQEEADHSGKKMVFSNWILSAEQAVMLHYGQSSKELQSLLLEWMLQLCRLLELEASPENFITTRL